MSLIQMIRDGYFDDTPYEFDTDLLTDEVMTKLNEKKMIRIASRIDFRVMDLLLRNDSIDLVHLSVHLRDTGWMVNLSVDQMIQVLGVSFTFDKPLYRIAKIPPKPKSWWERLF